MSGRRRGEQHCHMRYEKREDGSVQNVSSCRPAHGGMVGSRPSAACEEDSHHANPIYRPLVPESVSTNR